MKDKNIKQNQGITDVRKSEWINQVMDSTADMLKASPAPGLHERIFLKINEQPTTNYIDLPLKRWVAAAILLMALNIGSVIYYSSRNNTLAANSDNPLAAELSSGSTYNY